MFQNRLVSATGFPVLDVRSCLVLIFVLATGFSILDTRPRQFLILSTLSSCFQNNLWRMTRRQGDRFVQNFLCLHTHHFCNAVAWDRVVKDGCIGPCLVRCQSLLLSNRQLDPIHCDLVHFSMIPGRYNSWTILGFVTS